MNSRRFLLHYPLQMAWGRWLGIDGLGCPGVRFCTIGEEFRPGLNWVPLRGTWPRLVGRVEGAAPGLNPFLCFLSHLMRDPAGDHAFVGSDNGWFDGYRGEPTGKVLRTITVTQL